MQIEQYLPYFPLERIHIVKSEDLRSHRDQTLSRVFDFLGLETHSVVPDDVDREFNLGRERRRHRSIAFMLPRLPGYRFVSSRTPQRLRATKRRMTTRRMGEPPDISEATRRELEDALRDDVRRLRNYIRGDFDGWGIA
jgi:hypothetical protein